MLSSTGKNLECQEVPLKLSWAMKIHKSQGLTLLRTAVDLGPSESIAGLPYVAVFKVRKLSDLMIEATSHERLKNLRMPTNFSSKIQEEVFVNLIP